MNVDYFKLSNSEVNSLWLTYSASKKINEIFRISYTFKECSSKQTPYEFEPEIFSSIKQFVTTFGKAEDNKIIQALLFYVLSALNQTKYQPVFQAHKFLFKSITKECPFSDNTKAILILIVKIERMMHIYLGTLHRCFGPPSTSLHVLS